MERDGEEKGKKSRYDKRKKREGGVKEGRKVDGSKRVKDEKDNIGGDKRRRKSG